MEVTKQKILECVNEEELIQLTKDICSFPSYSRYESDCARFLAKFMKDNGFEVELQEVEPDRFQTIGRLKGTGEGPSMMFNAHMDIGPLIMFTWTNRDPYDPYVREGRIHGHGIENMKGGLVAMVMAAVAIKRAKIKLKGDLIVCPVVGELTGGVGTKYLMDNDVIPDYALVPEPSGLMVRTTTAGCATFLINTLAPSARVRGVSKPGFRYFGYDALGKMIKVYYALKEANRTKDFTYTYFSKKVDLPRIRIGGIIGGSGREHSFFRCPPHLPEFCTLGIDVRTVPGQTEESVKNDLVRILTKLKADDPEFHFEIEGPPATYTKKWPLFKHFIAPADISPDEWIVKLTAKNHEFVTGDKCAVGSQPHSNPYDDAGHLHAAHVKVLTYGPRARAFVYPDGTTEDAMDIQAMMTTAKVYAATAFDVCTISKEDAM